MAPRTGPSTAVSVAAIVVAHAKRVVASIAVSPSDAKSLKNGGKIATTTVAQNAESAQSYIAQARSSGRCSPRRVSRGRGGATSERLPRDPFAQQRVHDDVPGAFLQQHVLLHERRERR